MERVNDAVLLVGRLLMASLFLTAGIPKAIGYIYQDQAYTGFLRAVTNSGLPYPEIWALVGIAVEVLGPIALILGIFPRISALLMIAFVVAATGIAHLFWQYPEAQYMAQRGQFFKNIALIGGLLFYYVSGPGAWSLAGRSVGVGSAQPAVAKA